MPELMIDLIVTLDGYAAGDGWPGFWGLEGPEYLAWLGEQEDHTLLMGAATYRLMSGLRAQEPDAIAAMDPSPKVAFSSSLTGPLEWPNTELVTTDAVEAVRSMKADGQLPLRTMGSLSLSRSLLEAGLVDRFRLVVFPLITGASGRERIYDHYPDVGLDLLDSRTFDGRLQLLDYRPVVLDHPPLA